MQEGNCSFLYIYIYFRFFPLVLFFPVAVLPDKSHIKSGTSVDRMYDGSNCIEARWVLKATVNETQTTSKYLIVSMIWKVLLASNYNGVAKQMSQQRSRLQEQYHHAWLPICTLLFFSALTTVHSLVSSRWCVLYYFCLPCYTCDLFAIFCC